jgi:cytochrome c553
MKKIISILLLTLSSTGVFASDAKHHDGKSLHDKKCTSCHSDKVYSREERMVKTMSALEHQVNNCMKGAAKAEWTKNETTSVIDFLNDRYYKF